MRSLLFRLLPLLFVFSQLCHAIPSNTEAIANYEFQTAYGNEIKLSDLRGSVVVLHFMASWCGECLIEAPSINRLRRITKDDGIEIVGVSLDEYLPAVEALVSRANIKYPVICDHGGKLKKFFSIRGVPVTIVLDKSGQVAQFTDPETGRRTEKVQGSRDWGSEAAVRSLREVR